MPEISSTFTEFLQMLYSEEVTKVLEAYILVGLEKALYYVKL
jgi:hypothetical protein